MWIYSRTIHTESREWNSTGFVSRMSIEWTFWIEYGRSESISNGQQMTKFLWCSLDTVSELPTHLHSRKSRHSASRSNSSIERNPLTRRSVWHVSTRRWNRTSSIHPSSSLEAFLFLGSSRCLSKYVQHLVEHSKQSASLCDDHRSELHLHARRQDLVRNTDRWRHPRDSTSL